MQEQDTTLVFLSYSSSDKDRVSPLYEALEASGFNVWCDYKSLKPGQNWDFEIQRALEKSSIVIVFLSSNSITKRGYLQRELKTALDKKQDGLIDDINLIPIVLDDEISIPEELRKIQCISANSPECIPSVIEALNLQLSKLGTETKNIQTEKYVSWSFHTKTEEWDGLPGYNVELQFINLQSGKYSNINEIGEYIQGRLLEDLFSCRKTKLYQSPERFNYGQDKYRRCDTFGAHCSDTSIIGRVISIAYSIHWYGAGAAHPNMHFQTYSFVMDPLILISSLKEILINSASSFLLIQKLVRTELKKINLGDEDEAAYLDEENIDSGTNTWADLNSFMFKDETVEISFSPYQVAAYACGPQFVEIPYIKIIELILPEYKSALGIDYIEFRKRHSLLSP